MTEYDTSMHTLRFGEIARVRSAHGRVPLLMRIPFLPRASMMQLVLEINSRMSLILYPFLLNLFAVRIYILSCSMFICLRLFQVMVESGEE